MNWVRGPGEEKPGRRGRETAPWGCLGRGSVEETRGMAGGGVMGEPAATGVGPGVCGRSSPGSGRSRDVHDPGRTLRPREVILMSPEGTDLGIPPEEELRPLGLEDQKPQRPRLLEELQREVL